MSEQIAFHQSKLANNNLLETGIDGVALSDSILQLHQIIEELRGEIRELRNRVAVVELNAGESADPAENVIVTPQAPVVLPSTTPTTTTTTTVKRA